MEELPERIRAFVAVPIPEQVRARLAQVQHELKHTFRDVAWIRPESIHLTLTFLGNIERQRLIELQDEFRRAASRHVAFTLQLASLGSFGNRVIWSGVGGDVEPLGRLAETIRAALAPFGSHAEDRAFSAHVTLGRCKRPERQAAMKLRAFPVEPFGQWRVDQVNLYRSELSRDGARHTVLATVSLRGV